MVHGLQGNKSIRSHELGGLWELGSKHQSEQLSITELGRIWGDVNTGG